MFNLSPARSFFVLFRGSPLSFPPVIISTIEITSPRFPSDQESHTLKPLENWHIGFFSFFYFFLDFEDPRRRIWLPTPLFLPGESHGQRSLVGYSPRGQEESDRTEGLTYTFHSCFTVYKIDNSWHIGFLLK